MTHPYKSIHLAKEKDKRLKKGHQWIFSNELVPTDHPLEIGQIVRVFDAGNAFKGIGYYHPNSLIAVRMLSRRDVTIDASFFKSRLKMAVALRDNVIRDTDAYRLIYAESDGLPGLIVDRYGDGLVLQILSAGMEKQRNIIIDTLGELLKPAFLILRNDNLMREREGLQQEKQVIVGNDDDIKVPITENSVHYTIDLLNGHRTGFYLDQRDNRKLFQSFIPEGAKVLDAFCHYGGFAVHAALGGASEVIAIDNSESVLASAVETIRRNDQESTISTQLGDLFQLLPGMAKKRASFDVINLDPPNLATNRKSVGPALREYRKIHGAALEMLKPGGILATSTCSHHITREAFMESIQRACKDSRRHVQLLHNGAHPPDHPTLPEMPETEYLKFFIFRVTETD